MKEITSISAKDARNRNHSGSQKSLNVGFYKDRRFLFPLLAFFITAALFIVSCFFFNVAPFGNTHILCSDLKAQYAPFLSMWKHHILKLDFNHLLESLSYSFDLGSGKNFIGTFAYYLASPLNFLLFLFNDETLYNGIIVLITLKLSFSACFMCMFLQRKAENHNRAWPILLGIIYAFSSYTMIFMFNVMWLDGYMLLPLLLLFIEKFLEDGKYKGIVPVLVVLFIAQFYIAYMVGVYSFLYLVVRIYEKIKIEGTMNRKQALKKAGKFIVTALICAMISAVVLFPAAFDILSNSDVTSDSETNKVDVVTLKAISVPDQIFLGSAGDFSEVLPQNPPYIFLSLLVTSAVAVYLASDFFKGKQKNLYLVCIVAMYVFFAVDAIDIFWQAFDHPNWFWHRYSFVFFPFMLTIALKVLENAKNILNKDIKKAYLVLLALLFAAQSFGKMKDNGLFFVLNVVFLSAIMLFYSFLKREKWPQAIKNMQKLSAFFICLFVVCETVFINPSLSAGLASLRNISSAEDYTSSASAIITFADAAKKSGTGERSEFEYVVQKDMNNRVTSRETAGIASYMGTSLFNTASNKPYHRFLKQLGYRVNYNYFFAEYAYASKPVDMFFSIDTVFTESEYSEARFITEDFFDAGYNLYAYSDCLPMGFAVSNDANDFDFYRLETDVNDKNYFMLQNDWYASMFPSFTENFYNIYDKSSIDFEYLNGEALDLTTYGYENKMNELYLDSLGQESEAEYGLNTNRIYRVNDKIPIIMNISFTAEHSGEHYVNVSVPGILDDIQLIVDGEKIQDEGGNSPYSLIYRLGYFEAGDEVSFSFACDKNYFTYNSFNVAYFDGDAFDSMFGEINKDSVKCTSLENGYVTMTTDISSDEIVLTSIPYEKGWTLYIDGVETEITPYQDALISFNPGTGSHNIELKFVAPGLKIGIVVSAVGILLLAVVGIYDITLGKNKKKDITVNK